MRIRCMITRSFLTRYLYGELGVGLSSYLRRHLDECDRCRAQASEEKSLRQQIAGFAPPEVADGEWDELWDGVMRRVETGEEPISIRSTVRFPRHRTWTRYAVIAAAVAVLVAGALVRLMFVQDESPQAPISSLIQYHENAVDTHVLLEDHFWNAQVLSVSYATNK